VKRDNAPFVGGWGARLIMRGTFADPMPSLIRCHPVLHGCQIWKVWCPPVAAGIMRWRWKAQVSSP